MKQSAVKTLGVAALGAAFAAVGAGVADAAPAVPDGLPVVGSVAHTLPAANVTHALPGAAEAVSQGQGVIGGGLNTARPALQKMLAQGPTAPVAGLLGGLPAQGLPTHGLPTHGLGFNGIPLG
ncbi:ATP-binding protein [Streptomyces sp. NPDC058459]|uniref:ATP-binding protein n=1 Tax=Streptomyces sp. NPDC058459 TaxID=3346508 RepID=UPI00364DC69E